MDKFPLLLGGQNVGELTAEREALYTWFTVRCHLPGDGFWCAWVVGELGELRLGILEPAGNWAVIRRKLSRRMTEPLGRVLRGEARPMDRESVDWVRVQQPEQLFRTPWLCRALHGLQGMMTRREGLRRYLAIPYDHSKPFPLVSLFCFARLETLDGKPYIIFGFDEEEWPQMP